MISVLFVMYVADFTDKVLISVFTNLKFWNVSLIFNKEIIRKAQFHSPFNSHRLSLKTAKC